MYKISKYNKVIGVDKRLSVILPRDTLLTIYKMFVRPHVDYAYIFNKHNISCFVKKKLKAFIIKHVLPLQEQFKEHLKRNFIKKLG